MKTMIFRPKNSEAGYKMYKTLIEVMYLLSDSKELKAQIFLDVVTTQITKFSLKTDKLVNIEWTLRNWVIFGGCLHQLITETLKKTDNQKRYLLVSDYCLLLDKIAKELTNNFTLADFMKII